MTDPTAAGARRSRRRIIAVVSLTLAVCLVVAGVIGTVIGMQTSQTAAAPLPTATSMNGKAVTLDPGEAPISAEKSKAVADTGARFVIPSVGLDVPLGAMNEVDGQVTPPGFTSAYRIRDLGVATDDHGDGTVFVAMHSLRNGAIGPGNYVIDVATGTPKIVDGAAIEVDGVTYHVTQAQRIAKTQLPHRTDVWADTPDRLVVITCLQNPQNVESAYNVVITATR